MADRLPVEEDSQGLRRHAREHGLPPLATTTPRPNDNALANLVSGASREDPVQQWEVIRPFVIDKLCSAIRKTYGNAILEQRSVRVLGLPFWAAER